MRQVWPRWPTAMFAFAALVLTSVFAAGAARADQSAESFVTENANKALQTLNDDAIPLSEKKQQFRALVDQIADVPRITRFVLGRYSRGLDESEMKEFSEVFKDYAIGVYESRLGEYAGETLTVTGSTDRAPGDTIVHSQVAGGNRPDPLPVNWRVLTDENGTHKVVDVEVLGVWLAINQREEITGIIDNNRGRVDAAIQALKGKIAEQQAAG